MTDPEARTVIGAQIEAFEAVPEAAGTPDAVKEAIQAAGKAAGARGKGLYVPLRLAIAGEEHGPDVARILHALGRNETLGRLGAARSDHRNV
jgi:glutamyl/glutaminyl-tRNA synthetase